MICALMMGRVGSTGFPKKNIKKVLGRHLFEYPLIASKDSKYVEKTLRRMMDWITNMKPSGKYADLQIRIQQTVKLGYVGEKTTNDMTELWRMFMHHDFERRKKADKKAQTKQFKELHGLTRALIANMIEGVCNGYSKELNLVGVGYTADASKGNYLLLNLGYSHPIYFQKPDSITFETPSATSIIIKGIDKQVVGQVAAKIRSLRKPEPYKGKGIRYSDEIVRRKAGKKIAGAPA